MALGAWRCIGFAFPKRGAGPTFVLGCGNLCFTFPERGAKPTADIHSGLRNLCFTFPERRAKPRVDIHSGLLKPRFPIPRTKIEAYGPHSFWGAETYVLHSQNEVRSLWSTFILGCGNLGFLFPERGATPRARSTFIRSCGNVCFMFPERNAKPMVGHSFWVAEG